MGGLVVFGGLGLWVVLVFVGFWVGLGGGGCGLFGLRGGLVGVAVAGCADMRVGAGALGGLVRRRGVFGGVCGGGGMSWGWFWFGWGGGE
ncbi:hypothetical protein [Pseudomonas syringae group genomosp. 7]|uniref:hypothetical protein n=1 Tax=Pseudomonas syringae group genomosp. 7 TaxID=251699 RepID=UPI00377013C8